jgi:RHS repeat-associated protein
MKKNKLPKTKVITLRQLSVQFVSILVALSIFMNSVSAAPPIMISAVSEFSQDVRFAFLSSKGFQSFQTLLGFSFLSLGKVAKPLVTSIRILPGSVTVNQGESVTFSAVGYDSKDEAVGGFDLQWTITDIDHKLPARSLHNSTFEAIVPGTFKVEAKGNGHQAEAKITVLPAEKSNLSRFDSEAEVPRIISSRSQESDKNTDGQKTNPESENIQKSLDPGTWGDGNNWQSADDPGNGIGNPPGNPVDGGAGSGNFQMSAPVLSLPGRGIDLALNLNYNSRLWNISGNQVTYDIDAGFPAPGWSLGFGKIVDMGLEGGSMLVDADGTRHGYVGVFTPGTLSGFPFFRGRTTDGKFIDYKAEFNGNGNAISGQAWFPNGTSITYGARGGQAVYPTLITEANGNQILITYVNNQGPALETVTDTLGRVITFQYDSLGRLLSAKAPRMQGEDPVYGSGTVRTLLQLHYKPLTLNYSFASGTTPVIRNPAPQYLIDAVYYPATNTGYWFGDSDSYSSYGMLAKVIEQRGMNWTTGTEAQGTVVPGTMTKQALYNYPLTTLNESGRTNGVGLSDAPTYTNLTESWAEMDVAAPAVTTYLLNNNTTYVDEYGTSQARLVTITQPNGMISKQYSFRTPGTWTDGLVFVDETFVLNGQTEVRVGKSRVNWQLSDSPYDYSSPRPSWAEVFDENNKKVRTVYSYTSGLFNQVTKSCDYDDANVKLKCANSAYENSDAYKGTWYSVGSGSNTFWYFFSGRHILNLPTSVSVENPDGTLISKTDYEYDNYQSQPLVNTPGVIKHNSASNPFTTETHQEPLTCLQWVSYPGGQTCVQWTYQTVSNYYASTDKRGNVTKETNYADAQNPNSGVSNTNAYDITGNLVKSSTSCCQETSILYDDPNTSQIDTQYAYPYSKTRGSSNTNSPDRITTYSVYNFDTGLLKQTTDANGRISVSMFNPNTIRPVKSVLSTGAYTLLTYNDTSMTTAEDVYESGGNLAAKSTKYFNGLGQVRREESLGSNGIQDIVDTKYNQFGDIWKQSRPYRTGETPIFGENIYDSQGRITQSIQTDGSVSKSFYNETARPDSASTEIGSTIRVADAWGRERWGRYDQKRQLVEVVEPNPNGNGTVFAPGSLKTSYFYDALGRLAETVQGSQNRKFKYDSLGRLIRQKLAEQTATLDDAGNFVLPGSTNAKVWSESFVYDNRSNLVEKTDARNVKTTYKYTKADNTEDALNRLQSINYDASGATNVLSAPGVSYQYMTTGDKTRLQQIRTDGILTENYTYDLEGRVSDFTQTVDYRTSYPMTTSYLYDSLDRTKEIRYPAQYGLAGNPRKLIEQTYDTASRLATLKVGGLQQAGNIVYNSSDQTESIKIGTAGTNQVTETYTYDSQNGLLTQQKATRNGTDLLNLSYTYARNASAGNQAGKTGHLTKIVNNLDAKKNREYVYDALGRLKTAIGGNGFGKGQVNSQQDYTYDRFGNRTNIVAAGSAANGTLIPRDGIPDLTYNLASNRISNPGFEYDAAGNQTRTLAEDGVTWLRYQYDAANRLQVVTNDAGAYQQAYQFGSSNQRLMDYDYISNQFKIIGNGGEVEYTEYAATVMTWAKSYVYLGDRLLSTATPNGGGSETIEYNHPDRLGTKLITNQAGGTSYEQSTLPFGTGLNAETSGTTSKRFTSYERSSRTGLDYAVNRTYDNKLGRFTQVDPIGMQAVSLELPQTMNLYNYCGNDPINHTDPDGLFWGAIGRFFQRVGRAINRVLGNIIVQIVITVIFAVVTLGASAIATYSIMFGAKIATPIALKILAGVLAVASWAGKIATGLELTGLLLQGKFKQLGKIIGLAFVGALAAIVEDSISNGVYSAWKKGENLFSGAWRGFKDGLNRLKEVFSRGLKDFFIAVYGFWCGPGYGVDNVRSGGEIAPADGVDKACKTHDKLLAERKHDLLLGKAVKSTTYFDLRLIKSVLISTVRPRFSDIAFGSGHRIGDVFGYTVPFAFGIRIAKNQGR